MAITPSVMSILLTDAIALACRVHRNQIDKAGAPYILHPLRVMAKVDGEILKMIAVLHDVIEDSADFDEPITSETLASMGFPLSVIHAVNALSRRGDESYQDFILRLSDNPKAILVKLADLEDNMDLSRLPEVSEKDLQRYRKYHDAHRLLKSLL